jgi:hypothetical protein
VSKEIDQLIREKRLYFVGDKLPSDFYEAVRIWLPLAEAGDAKAQYNIGRCYNLGDGIDKDNRKAFGWYQKAADQGDPRAYYNLSLVYEEGDGCEIDTAKAQELRDKAAGLGDVRALCIQADDAFAKRDVEKARSLYKKAADQGHVRSEIGVIACDLRLKADYQGYKISGYSSTIVEGSERIAAHSKPNIKFTVSNKSSTPVQVKLFTESTSKDEKGHYETQKVEIGKNDSVGIPCFITPSKSGREKLIGMEVNGEEFTIDPILIADWSFMNPYLFLQLMGGVIAAMAGLGALLYGSQGFWGGALVAVVIFVYPVIWLESFMQQSNARAYFSKKLTAVK